LTVHALPSTLHLFFLSRFPPPPRSTLFPYTTLFRSMETLMNGQPLTLPNVPTTTIPNPFYEGTVDATGKLSGVNPDSLPVASTVDRKSTRLNSSHVAISYAVFCLKKKI